MAHLTTDFIKIAQVGPSIDGRFIREDWLRDMAATYDPAVYTALLWPEHARWYGNLGEVLELKAEPDDMGVLSLFARLKPNASFLQWNAAGQGLFYSIEVDENFAESGTTYLAGLGVTDSPASLGLPSTRFSASKHTTFIGNVPLEPFARTSEQSDTRKETAEDAPGWFKRFLASFSTTDSADADPAQKEDAIMPETEARLTALEEGLAALTDTVADLSAKVAGLEVDAAAKEGGDPASDDPAYKALARHIGDMRKEFAALGAKLSAARPGTPAGVTTGPEGGKGIL